MKRNISLIELQKSAFGLNNCDLLFRKILKIRPTERDTVHFTLIELLVSTACKIGVLPLYYLKKNL